MRSGKRLLAGAVLAGAVSLVLAFPTLAVAKPGHGVYSFELSTPNTSVSPNGGMMAAPGDWISLTGSGTFDVGARTVTARGKFVHYNADGSIHCRGTWQATGFTSFTDFGADDQGEEGGQLSIMVTHYCSTTGTSMAGIAMTVTSTVNAPAGSVEGSTQGDFTKPTGGTVVIEPEQ